MCVARSTNTHQKLELVTYTHFSTRSTLVTLKLSLVFIFVIRPRNKTRLSILAITAHWVDDDNVLREIILYSLELIGSHSGENIAKTVLKCLKEFKIDAKGFTITADNAANNRAIAKDLAKDLKQFDHSIHLFGCMGHVINLAAKRGLYTLAAFKEYELEEIPEENDGFEQDLDGLDDIQSSEEEYLPAGDIKCCTRAPFGSGGGKMLFVK